MLNLQQSGSPEGNQSGGRVPNQSPDPSSPANYNSKNTDPRRGTGQGTLPPSSAGKVGLGQEFFELAKSTVGPRALFIQSVGAGLTMARPRSNYPPEWRQGAQAFGRLYGDRLAAKASTQTARLLTAALMHEDLRYKPSESTNPLLRTAHAVAFTFVDRTNSGHSTLALSNFAGAAAGGFVGNAYLPTGFNDLTHAESRTALAFGTMAVKNIFSEYSPEIGKLARKIHLPKFPIPEWWVRDR